MYFTVCTICITEQSFSFLFLNFVTFLFSPGLGQSGKSLVRVSQLEHLCDVGAGFQELVLRDLAVVVQVAVVEVRLDLLQKLGLGQRLPLQLVQGLCYPEARMVEN